MEDRKFTTHKETVSIPAEQYDRVNRLLAIESLEDMTDQQLLDAGANTDQCERIYAVKFDDGGQLSFDLCSGRHNYFDSVIWTSPEGWQEDVFDCAYELDDIQLQIEDDIYCVKVIREEKK